MASKNEIEQLAKVYEFLSTESFEEAFAVQLNSGNYEPESVKEVFQELTDKSKKHIYKVEKKRGKYVPKIYNKKQKPAK